LLKATEQALIGTGLLELLTVEPDRLGIRHWLVQGKSCEAHEGRPVAQLELSLFVGEAVERLQHQDPEHQHGIIRRAPTAAAVRTRQCRIQHRAEDLEVHHG
jgi:hypothetical protein